MTGRPDAASAEIRRPTAWAQVKRVAGRCLGVVGLLAIAAGGVLTGFQQRNPGPLPAGGSFAAAALRVARGRPLCDGFSDVEMRGHDHREP